MSEPAVLQGVVHCLDERRVGAFYAALADLTEAETSPGDVVTYAGAHVRLSFVRVPPVEAVDPDGNVVSLREPR